MIIFPVVLSQEQMWSQQRLFFKYLSALCGILIFVALIYDNYRPYINVYYQIPNNSIAVERALQQIPTCSPDDRSRQRSLLHTLRAWTHFARQNRIEYWIAYGTLLGYVQNHSLLPHDTNLDVFIMVQHASRLSPRNFSSEYKLQVYSPWNIVDHTPNARFVHLKDNLYVNIWPVHDYNPNETKTVINDGRMLTSFDKNYEWKSTPREWTFPLVECELNGVKVWCPAEPKQLVINLYGTTSVNESSVRCMNGSWIPSDTHKSTSKKIETTKKSTTTSTVITTHTSTIKRTPASSTYRSTTLSDDDFIERSLETIPTCTPRDRHRQRTLLALLQAWSRLAEKHNIEYCLVYGTLVGYVQRQGLLPHDLDIDIILTDEQIPKLINISRTNFSSIYTIKVQPQWQMVGESNRAYFRDQGINFIAPNARFRNIKTYDHVDIYPVYDFNPLYSNRSIQGIQSDNLTIYGSSYEWMSFSRKWIYPLETCYYSGIKTLCPAKPKELVSIMYGASALTKSDRKCENGTWVSA